MVRSRVVTTSTSGTRVPSTITDLEVGSVDVRSVVFYF